MPAFWRSLLGGSSSSGAAASSSSGNSNNNSNSRTDSSNTASPSKKAAAGSSSSSGNLNLAGAGSASASNGSSLRQPPSTTPTTAQSKHVQSPGHSVPIVIPGQSSSSSSAGSGTHPGHAAAAGIPLAATTSRQQQQHSTSVASTSGLSGLSSTSYADTADDTDDASIPETPYSSGHSPSHARHKFPVEGSSSSGNNSNKNNSSMTASNGKDKSGQAAAGAASGAEDSDAFLSDDEVPGSSDARGKKEPSSTSGKTTSSSTSSPSSPSSPVESNARQSPFKPDIPTTHTILANPLPQPSSGLAAAISSVLPSSTSSNNTSLPGASSNGGKGALPGSGPDASAPRTFDIDDMITRLLETGYSGKVSKAVSLKNSEITALCLAAREVFLSQPTLLELSPPVNIVGDVHGQYSDLIRLFEMCSFPPRANYLFLGDYVDRGKQSLETILLLLCYKVKYPENFFLLRGNHECANVTRVYGFYDECKRRCNLKIWKTFVDVFNCLPIAALVAGKIFCVHGGLSPSLSSMDDIRRISRPTDVPDYGLLNDLLWSDPSDTALDWEDNERGVSYCFGKAVIQEFLAKYDFDLICRAHMVVEDGYEFWNDRTLVTIFSAPNYCGEFDNFASSMLVNEDLLCSFELLKPLDGAALKKELAKCRKKNSAGLLLPRTAV